jgi:TM2 domain-containing membrane protein YozV
MAYNSSIDLDRDSNRQFVIDATVETARKSTPLAYVLWFFFGGFGVHNFYLGKPILAGLQLAGTVTYLATKKMGGPMMLLAFPIIIVVLISLLIDMCLIPVRVRAHSARLRSRLEEQAGWR